MSLWVFHEVVAAGGVDTTAADEPRGGHCATYRGYRLRWSRRGTAWAVSTGQPIGRWPDTDVAGGSAPATLADLNALLDDVDAARADHGDDTDRWPDDVFDHLFPEMAR